MNHNNKTIQIIKQLTRNCFNDNNNKNLNNLTNNKWNNNNKMKVWMS